MPIDAEKPTHDTVMDVSKERIARVYAQAFMDVARQSPEATSLVEEVGSFVEDIVGKLPQLELILHSALVDNEQKERLLDRMLKGSASETVLNFLKVLCRHGRLTLLRPIAGLLKKLDAERRGITDVEVRLAAPTDNALLADIENRLRKALGREPVLHVSIEPELVAGFVVRVGDRVFDGSIRTQLEHTRRAMIERATEKIETQPEQFLNAAT
jgi:F-type H+-transporting ATPase subunit delta